MDNIILVGFMGTGKSAAGRLLAKRLKRPFIDLDERIERKAGQSIPAIFEKSGEAGFRRMESEAVREAAGLKGHVIATGGGVMLDEANVAALKRSGTLICLTARPDVIISRTSAGIAARPLLVGSDPETKVRELLKLREPFYAKADMTLDTSDKPVERVVDEIMRKLK
ncbi:MAG: shikimate kinase [Candidatus Omnitrophica bacterium]|nr:shikimate kinase [Candidatus Omnitrophota bacterium]